MGDYTTSTYGDRIAEAYDEIHPSTADAARAVATLAELAAGGPVLELAIGTGRLALPLVDRGVPVQGIDASEAMVARLRAKPGGDAIEVTMGDFADVGVDGRFALVFVAFNTLFALLSQDDQVRCFANVASHLEDDGVFVVEAFVPDLTLYDGGQRVSAMHVGTDSVRLDASRLDRAEQRVAATHVVLNGEGARLYPIQLRYAWPAELDLMARLAGLRLRQRWADWERRPFDASSPRHVSVYGSADGM
jgi:SAM-dependent methyltransferase